MLSKTVAGTCFTRTVTSYHLKELSEHEDRDQLKTTTLNARKLNSLCQRKVSLKCRN